MVLLGDSIQYSNVVSKTYCFHYNEISKTIERFIQEIIQAKATIKGPLFYSINHVPMEEMVAAEFFMPVFEDRIELEEEMHFHSYYHIEDMITFNIHEQFETATEAAYDALMDFMDKNQLQQTTPIYHILAGEDSLQSVFIKVGIAPVLKKELVWND